ncbi:adenosine deaminase [Skermanella mucosa]|uniref:adenosine deaminase n=1 Tax=Skermanella mucosa TaxID=1789672 RepID=UPI00192B761A|nr:adenosine deaminase [Skermanella mucosa]UEM21609.1 adenosine deaminase [Skermanella mucosa]
MTMPGIPKAELHVHLEGTATPELVRALAERNGMALPPGLFTEAGHFAWTDFLHFLKVYDDAASAIRTARDYRDVTYDYLRRCAAEGAVYVEVMSSPDHARMAGLSFQDHLDGIVQGFEDARADFGIEARLIVTCVRHFGVERGLEVARACARHRHPLLTGFGMGGDENHLSAADFAPVFTIARNDAGLGCTVHAGESAGPESVRDALDHLPVSRIGHGVRSIEDADLIRRIAGEGIVLEVCPTSNIRTAVYGSYADHPLDRLRAAGCAVTLNSDDPPYFATTLGGEYEVAAEAFGWGEEYLRNATVTALEAAFLDAETRGRLLGPIKSAGSPAAGRPNGGHGPGSGR